MPKPLEKNDDLPNFLVEAFIVVSFFCTSIGLFAVVNQLPDCPDVDCSSSAHINRSAISEKVQSSGVDLNTDHLGRTTSFKILNNAPPSAAP